jgi:hypothetical protein
LPEKVLTNYIFYLILTIAHPFEHSSPYFLYEDAEIVRRPWPRCKDGR